MASKPNRQFMDDPNITWRTIKPDYTKADRVFEEGRTRHHKEGSLARTVEDAVKTFEMEATHKLDPKDWQTVDVEKFRLHVNGRKTITVAELIERGGYNCYLEEHPLYTGKDTTFDESDELFKGCFTDGFPWELLEVYGEMPTVVFTWRHWAKFSGPFRGKQPTGETLEMYGTTIATSDDKGRLIDVQLFFDTTPILTKLNHVKCPLNLGI